MSDKGILLYGILQRYSVKSPKKRRNLRRKTAEEVFKIYRDHAPAPHSRGPKSQGEVEALLEANATKPYLVVRAMLFPGCERAENRVSFEDLPSCYTGTSVGRVDRELERDRALPPSFVYCSRMIWEGPDVLKSGALPKDCSLHWSVIVARKRIAGKCQYLVRNTLHPERPVHPAFVQDGDDYWIDRETLRKGSLLFQWLGNR